MTGLLEDSPITEMERDQCPELTATGVMDHANQIDVAPSVPAKTLGPGQFPGLFRPLKSLWWLIHLSFGIVCLVLILAVLAAIPGLNLLTLGYMLSGQKRVAASGRLRDGFPLMTLAPRLGCIAFFVLMFLIPVRILAVQCNAALIVRHGTNASSDALLTGLVILKVVTAIHLMLAIACGGSASCFVRPIRNLRWLARELRARRYLGLLDTWTVEEINILRPCFYILLGLKSVVGALLWLLMPTALLVAYSAPGRVSPGFALLSFAGGLGMVLVAAWLPMLQVHQALEGKFRAIFSLSVARQIIRNAPIAWLLSSVVLYVMTLPLYLAKIRLLPSDAFLVLTPIFVIATYPSRILIAKAYHRGIHRAEPAWFGFRWGARLLSLPLLTAYVVFLFLTPTISELGKAAPLENHAFMSPVPYAQWASKD